MATEVELFTLVKGILDAGLAAQSLSSIVVKRGNQSTQQGIVNGPAVYFWPIDGVKYGFQGREDKYNSTAGTFTHTEKSRHETTIQFNCLATTGDNQTTSADIASICAALLQTESAIATMVSADVGVLRIGNIRNLVFLDDQNNYKHSASFDAVFVHHRKLIATVPAIESITFNADRV